MVLEALQSPPSLLAATSAPPSEYIGRLSRSSPSSVRFCIPPRSFTHDTHSTSCSGAQPSLPSLPSPWNPSCCCPQRFTSSHSSLRRPQPPLQALHHVLHLAFRRGAAGGRPAGLLFPVAHRRPEPQRAVRPPLRRVEAAGAHAHQGQYRRPVLPGRRDAARRQPLRHARGEADARAGGAPPAVLEDRQPGRGDAVPPGSLRGTAASASSRRAACCSTLSGRTTG